MFYILDKKDIKNIAEKTIEQLTMCRGRIDDVIECVANNELEKIKNYLMNYEDFALSYYVEFFNLIKSEVEKIIKKYGNI